ncbi:MAG TPA: tetratricopeptide repeat protein [Bacteroidia bacterium]|jgi:tetratricopeptide (TPR) repeat protein
MKKQKNNKAAVKNQELPVIDKKLLFRLSFIIAAVAFLIYANTLGHGFVLDDSSVISDNTMTQGGVSSLKDIFTSAYRAGQPSANLDLYRPLSKAMFAVEWQLSPDNPAIHHFVNVLLYSFACVLMFLIFSRWTRINIYILFFSTLIFAVHPIHTEVVANIKSRDEILTMIFLLLSLNAALKYLDKQKIVSFISYLFCFFLALLSKESAIVYVGLIPLFIYFFTLAPAGTNIKMTGSAAAVAVLYLIIHRSIIGSIGLDNIPVIDNSLLSTSSIFLQKLTAVMIMGKYFLLLLFPYPLSCDYSFNTIPIVSGIADPGFLFSMLFHVFLLVFAIKKFKDKHILSFCILFYLVSMSIASNIFMTIGTHLAERLLFLPSIAFCIALSYCLCMLMKINTAEQINKFSVFFNRAKVYVVSIAALAVIFSFKTSSRNKDWKSNAALFEKDIETVPNSAHMLMYLTDHLITKEDLAKMSPEGKKARLLKAKAHIEKALKIYELFPDAHFLAGRISYELGDFQTAYIECSRALSLNPSKPMYHNNTGTALFALGRFNEAAKEFEEAMRLNPDDPDHPFNLGSAHGAMGESYKQQNDTANANKMFRSAIVYFDKAIRMKPDYKSAHQFMGATYRNMGDTVNAKIYFDQAARLKTKQ